jgi:nucleoside-diphosphate-sugar epimerase
MIFPRVCDHQCCHLQFQPAMDITAPTVCLVLGGSGFIGSHVCRQLRQDKRSVVMIGDIVPPTYFEAAEIAHTFIPADIRNAEQCSRVVEAAVETGRKLHPESKVHVYAFAADMGGMGYIADNDSTIVNNNTLITVNIAKACYKFGVSRVLFASSACVYPVSLQCTHIVPALSEDMAWPANPQDGYGLEKLYGEKVLQYAGEASRGTLEVRVARFHNVYGPRGTWAGGREKAPAALLRKALLLREHDKLHLPAPAQSIDLWGSGLQVRSFLYISDAVSGILALMHSDCKEPVNIGSEEAVTIEELAFLAAEAAGYTRVEIQHRLRKTGNGPIGVTSRNADSSLARTTLHWEPQTPLAQGLRLTAEWMKQEIDSMHKCIGSTSNTTDSWRHFVLSGLQSVAVTPGREPQRFALLVPVTSRMRGAAVAATLREFLESLHETIQTPHSMAWRFEIFFGVDEGDPVCDPRAAATDSTTDLIQLVKTCLPIEWSEGRVTASLRRFTYPPGSICAIWGDLAYDAWAAGCDFSVLLGDDILLLTCGWADIVYQAFYHLHTSLSLPFGFGCVAFADSAFPGFPTFPVVHRTHMDIFAGRIFPSTFKNQDADPFLFQVYRAFGAATLTPHARLTNTIGGANDARYAKRHVPWTGATLTEARNAASAWLHSRLNLVVGDLLPQTQPRCITLDVIVPTYRANNAILERILALPVPAGVSTQFTLIFDNPDNKAAQSVLQKLQHTHADNPFARLRMNPTNLGASASRNNGLAESAADWVLFLDDDVLPSPTILEEYASAIRSHPKATGFIGLSVLPQPTTVRQAGVIAAGVSFFWALQVCFLRKPSYHGVLPPTYAFEGSRACYSMKRTRFLRLVAGRTSIFVCE